MIYTRYGCIIENLSWADKEKAIIKADYVDDPNNGEYTGCISGLRADGGIKEIEEALRKEEK